MSARRRILSFACDDATLVGTLDDAPGTNGLLVVSGGNEIRAGAHRGMASLAARLADAGHPVFRYDRRGVGDSSGRNTGFEGARDDLLAAATAFRTAAPHVTRLVGFGNCDAATTLALWGRDAGLAHVILANPWVVEPAGDLPPPAAVRAHYVQRLRDPRALLRLARGGVSITRLIKGLHSVTAAPRQQPLTTRALAAITGWSSDATIVLAMQDNTAIAYADAARAAGVTPRTVPVTTASHSFARPGDAAALEAVLRDALSARG